MTGPPRLTDGPLCTAAMITDTAVRAAMTETASENTETATRTVRTKAIYCFTAQAVQHATLMSQATETRQNNNHITTKIGKRKDYNKPECQH